MYTKFGSYHNFIATTNYSPTQLDSKNRTLSHKYGHLPNKLTISYGTFASISGKKTIYVKLWQEAVHSGQAMLEAVFLCYT